MKLRNKCTLSTILVLTVLLSACAAKPAPQTTSDAAVTTTDAAQATTGKIVNQPTSTLSVEPEESDTWYEVPITLGYDPEKQLNGMLTLPKNMEAPPVAILIQGSGRNSMDSPIGASKNRFFADLAHGLSERGVASIRYDKRSYVYPDDVIDIQTEYLYDVKDAIRFALEEDRVNGEELYLVGHSQGGLLSPQIATDHPEIKGFISMGGTLRRLEDMILEQAEPMMAQNTSMTPEEKQAYIDETKAGVARIRSLNADSDARADVLIHGYPETYWKSLNTIDSRNLAAQLAAKQYPMLILHGINDFHISYEVDFEMWKETLAEDENASFIAYEGLSHVFMPGSRESFDGAVYDPPAHVEPQVIQDMADWITAQTFGVKFESEVQGLS